ncbi:MAG: glycosyltransferase [Pedobacter sp.]|nr:MAG: glycosyltransferase [Pedobacter sp.]
MKVLHLTPAYKPAFIYGGPTMSVARLCEGLQQYQEYNTDNQTTSPLEIEVFCTRANGHTELAFRNGDAQNIDGVKVTYFNRLTKDHTHFSPALLWALWKKIKTDKAQNPGQLIIHIHSWWNLVVIFGALIAKLQNVPIALSPRGMITSYTQTNKNSLAKTFIHKLFGKYLLKNVHLMATSKQEVNDYTKVCQPKSIHVIPNIVELPSLLPQKSTIDGPLFKLLFLSRVEEKKGLNLLLEALAKVEFSWSLSIAGTGSEIYINQLKSQIKELGLYTKVHWLGHQTNEQKYQTIAAHDLLCLTSYNENFANVVIESLAVGTPVLLSEQVGLADYVEKNELGFVCKLDVDAISESLTQAFENKTIRNQISQKSPNLIKQDFEISTLAAQYVQAYRKILAQPQ